MAAIQYKICVYSYNCKEISSMWLGYLYCFIGGFNCQGICTYTRRIHWLPVFLLCLGFFKCFNILYWKRMHKIVLKITQFHVNVAILNLQCTIVHCKFSMNIRRMAISLSHVLIYVLFVCLFLYRWLHRLLFHWLSDTCWSAERRSVHRRERVLLRQK
jgi:hypothetical protein